ncbi:MAG: effector binding domain-containing protein [Thermoflexales bacterium]|nr:effector binding domain-containing protein [Thermoflexales bacterium]
MPSIKKLVMSLFVHDVETRPRMVELEQPIQIVGMAIDTDIRNIYRDVPRVGKQFAQYKRDHVIPHKKQPWAFAAVSKDFDAEKKTFTYIIGDVVTSLQDVPPGLIAFEIPPITYAVFPVRPKNSLGWGIGIPAVKQYAYTGWLPGSGYEAAGIVDDFEYHDERSVSKNPEIDLYIAIRRK